MNWKCAASALKIHFFSEVLPKKLGGVKENGGTGIMPAAIWDMDTVFWLAVFPAIVQKSN